ncbi:MAG: phosphate ABC transporter permease PstA [Armatimonadetes bacterium]|nr:phosphate ABC transporter permease PstA [Armatimonadota bacterium]
MAKNKTIFHGERGSIVGFFATGLPLVAVVIVLLFIVVIVGNFIITGSGYLSWEFLTDSPRNMNTEGGIFPAIYGTVLLVLIMTLAAVPVGTITALYLTEYAKRTSIFARVIRFAVNTLAGIPSIVFGLFGLGFFIQTVGSQIDAARYSAKMDDLRTVLAVSSSPLVAGKQATINDIKVFLQNNEFDWEAQLRELDAYPEGTVAAVNTDRVVEYLSGKKELEWGKPSLIWAALTLALLTLPVVIVSVEEALRTVPREIREASLALGATRWETIWRIVLPNCVPGILTGSILAVSRGAGEVAPILFTGAVYSLQELPSSLSDQFMHLGYHLYILATQSPDVDATRPLQYATTLVLLGLTLALNLTAIMLRSRLRKRKMV